LGITLSYVGKNITIGGFTIAFYGIIIATAILVGIYVACREAKRTGQDSEIYMDLALYAVISAIIGARLYYVIFQWNNYYKDHPGDIINIRQGGLAIYGGVIASVLCVYVYGRVKHVRFTQMVDTAVLGLIMGQAIGRYGNFFNREAFGEYTDSLFAMMLPTSAVHPSDITEKMLANISTVDGVKYISVHPTFFYESMWNIGLFILCNIFKDKKAFEGEVFLWYLGGYGLGRFWIEGLRTDQLLIGGLIPVSQLLSIILILVFVAVEVYMRFLHNPPPKENN